MAAAPIDLSAGLIPKAAPIDLSAGLVPKQPATPAGLPAGVTLPSIPNTGYGNGAGTAPPSGLQGTPKLNAPGLLSSYADATGISVLRHPIDNGIAAAKSVGRSLINPYDPNGAYIKTIAPIIGNAVDQGGQALNMAKQGSLGAAASHALLATPVLGQGMQRAMDQTSGDQGSYGANLKSLVTNPGAMGTLAGTATVLADPAARGLTWFPGGDGMLSAAADAVPARLAAPINAIPSIPGKILKTVGPQLQEAGTALMNHTVGALKADFKRGANPARGYFNIGGGPAWSMQGIANQAAAAKDATGAQMGTMRDAAGNAGLAIPTSDVSGIISTPIAKARALELGPGGLSNTGTIDAYADNLAPTFQKAFANGNGMTPNDVFDLKGNIAKNTNWADPSQFNLKAVRQQQVGALGGLLSDSVPGYGAAATNYGDLNKMATRAQLRADTGSSPLTHIAAKMGFSTMGAGLGAFGGAHDALAGALAGAAVDSIPVKSTVASGLYYIGKGLGADRSGLLRVPLLDTAAIAPAANALNRNANDKNRNNGQQQGGLPLRRLPVPQY